MVGGRHRAVLGVAERHSHIALPHAMGSRMSDHITELCHIIDGLLDRVAALEARVQSVLPVGSLPFAERLPDKARITKLHGDLFENPRAKQGAPKRVLKVFVSLDGDQNRNGSIKPLHFW